MKLMSTVPAMVEAWPLRKAINRLKTHGTLRKVRATFRESRHAWQGMYVEAVGSKLDSESIRIFSNAASCIIQFLGEKGHIRFSLDPKEEEGKESGQWKIEFLDTDLSSLERGTVDVNLILGDKRSTIKPIIYAEECD